MDLGIRHFRIVELPEELRTGLAVVQARPGCVDEADGSSTHRWSGGMGTAREAETTDAFLKAIDLEIEAILTRSAPDALPLRQGIRSSEKGDAAEYVFQSRPQPDIEPLPT